MTRLCGACSAPYEAQRPHSKYCSDRCKQRAHRASRPKPPPVRRVRLVTGLYCQACGAAFTVQKQGGGGLPRYCSTDCRRTVARRADRKKKQTIPCAGCGQPMWQGRGSLPQGQARCRPCRRTSPARVARDGNCVVCGTGFNSTNASKRTCGRSCQALLVMHERTGTPLPDPAIQRQHVEYLAGLTDEDRARQRIERASARKRLKRLHQAQTWDGVPDRAILERDGWRCGICTKRINRQRKHPHPLSASIDHVIPLAHGGDDTAVNKRAAHLGCNLARGAGFKDEAIQLALLDVAEPSRGTWIHGEIAYTARSACMQCGQIRTNADACWKCRQHEPKPPVPPSASAVRGRRAAMFRASGMRWQDVAAAVGYFNLGNLYTQAMKHGTAEDVAICRTIGQIRHTSL